MNQAEDKKAFRSHWTAKVGSCHQTQHFNVPSGPGLKLKNETSPFAHSCEGKVPSVPVASPPSQPEAFPAQNFNFSFDPSQFIPPPSSYTYNNYLPSPPPLYYYPTATPHAYSFPPPPASDFAPSSSSTILNLHFFKSLSISEDRDYHIIIDRSGSMSGDLWQQCRKAVSFLAAPCCRARGSQGFSLCFFSDKVTPFHHLTSPDEVFHHFDANQPSGKTNLCAALSSAFDVYLNRNHPATFLVITDGSPQEKDSVKELICGFTQVVPKGQLSISFVQIGQDLDAQKFLHELDEELKPLGALYDMVDCLSRDDLPRLSFDELIQSSLAGMTNNPVVQPNISSFSYPLPLWGQ